MKTFLLVLTYFVGSSELVLGAYFWATNSNNEVRKLMSLMALSTGLWVITNGLASYTNPSVFINVIVDSIFVFAYIFSLSLVYFSFIYPYPIIKIDKLHKSLFLFVGIIYTYLAFFTNTIYSSYTITPSSPGTLNPGPLFIFFQISISITFITAIILLMLRYNKIDGSHKKNLAILITSIFIGGAPAIVLNMLYIIFSIYVNPLYAVIPSVLWVGGTSYILLRN